MVYDYLILWKLFAHISSAYEVCGKKNEKQDFDLQWLE